MATSGKSLNWTADERDAQLVAKFGRTQNVTFISEPEPEPLFCPIISVDDHALETATLFDGRLPAKFRDSAPFVEHADDGGAAWIIDGKRVAILMANGASGRPMEEWLPTVINFDEVRPGCWDPVARLSDMDLTGTWASLCFGSTIWGFAGTRFSQIDDPELGYACLQAYNDWMLEDWCGSALDRYIPCQLPWLRDPELAAREVRRNAARGFKAVSFSENPEGLGFPNMYDRYWDPFLRACEETGTVINLHVGSSGTRIQACSSSPESVAAALFPVPGIIALVDWIYSGVPLRFPGLTIALSEAGVSWVPMALERLSRAYRQKSGFGRPWPATGPSPMEVAHRNFVFTSIEDPSGFRMLDIVGADSVMVETDYPHFDSTWPDSQAMLRSEMSGLEAATIRKLCYENAARIYHHPEPPEQMLARAEVNREASGSAPNVPAEA
jgi:predicted TIM-barrel fold metal-dependent hydrolase